MTNNLKCPFCGAKLLGSLNEKYCTNRECEHYMRTIPTSIWQALIDGKKAQDALKIAIEALVYEADVGWDSDGSMAAAALKEITSITKQE